MICFHSCVIIAMVLDTTNASTVMAVERIVVQAAEDLDIPTAEESMRDACSVMGTVIESMNICLLFL